jgi:hypothetical protein
MTANVCLGTAKGGELFRFPTRSAPTLPEDLIGFLKHTVTLVPLEGETDQS